jgi:hypothetical protein
MFSILPFIQSQIEIPINVLEAIEFLLFYHSSEFHKHFEKSVSILTSQLKDFTYEVLNSFSYEIPEKIFSSNSLKISNDDFLFNLNFLRSYFVIHRRKLQNISIN